MDLQQIGIPDSNQITNGIRFRFARDDANIYLLAVVKGAYYFNLTAGNGFSHSVAVMWKIGQDATMFNMGGCPVPVPPSARDAYDCDAIQENCALETTDCNCTNYLTDMWHIETGSPGSIPGVQYPYKGPLLHSNDPDNHQPSVQRLYSGNDPTSNSDDEFSVHPCLRGDDGSSSVHLSPYRKTGQTIYRNQLRFAWSHTAVTSNMYPFGTIGTEGFYIYEFSRPLVTNENTDVQFQVGTTASFAFAFWIPPSIEEEWEDSNHYVAPPNFQFGTVSLQNNHDQMSVGNSSAEPAILSGAISSLMVMVFSLAAIVAST